MILRGVLMLSLFMMEKHKKGLLKMILILVIFIIIFWLGIRKMICPESVNCMPGPNTAECPIPFYCEGISKITW